jgi:phosphate transport system permease protein
MKRKIRFAELAQVSFVRFSAALTIACLFMILGYILWNGFFFSVRREYTVTSDASESLDGAALVAHPGVKLSVLPFDELRNLFTDEYTTWKKTDGQDLDLYPFMDDSVAARGARLLGSDFVGELVGYPGDASTTVETVAATEGACALVDARGFAALDPALKARVKVVSLRSVAFAVNPSVTELEGNRRIGTIEESAIHRIVAGKVSDWSAFDGRSLPIAVVIPPAGDPLRAFAERAGYHGSPADGGQGGRGARVIEASTLDEYYSLLSSTPGAAGFVPANLVAEKGLAPLSLAREESGRNLSLAFILEAPKDSGKIGGISTIILNTLAMIALTLLFAVPPGLFAAVYLVEYAREGRLVRLIRLGTETLAGVPSIIFGLFGMLVFVQGFGWGISLISGACTLTLMILPTIVRTAEEALKSVPRSFREGSLALGATRVQTIFRVVLPAAFPAISAGVILASGRALGETAALIYTMGSNYNLTAGLFDSTRTLAVHIYLIVAEGIASERAFASGAVLVFFILAINTLAKFAVSRVGRMARP